MWFWKVLEFPLLELELQRLQEPCSPSSETEKPGLISLSTRPGYSSTTRFVSTDRQTEHCRKNPAPQFLKSGCC
uniref:Uncharacterized protein n=1 Tax=Physcomitrium patens TaxID=3218 RepID=A0A2K1KFA2_PHYPA|nr:hypothetical protein PHYPA_008834 [Physcomitrium patens]